MLPASVSSTEPPAGAVSPRPDAQQRGLRERLHAAWRRSPFNPYRLDARLLHEGIAALARGCAGRLLDVGCGERPYAGYFPGVTRYVGIEHLGAVINVDHRLEASVAHVAHLVDAFAEGGHLPFRDASFDSALCIEVLEHVPDAGAVVAEIARVLRPGGALLVTVPFVGELHQTPYDFRRFTSFGLRRLLEDHGLQVEELRPRGNFVATAGRVLTHAVYRLGCRRRKRDGSVSLSPLAAPFVLPFCALSQLVFGGLSKLSRDDSLCLGYSALARRSRPSNAATPGA